MIGDDYLICKCTTEVYLMPPIGIGKKSLDLLLVREATFKPSFNPGFLMVRSVLPSPETSLHLCEVTY